MLVAVVAGHKATLVLLATDSSFLTNWRTPTMSSAAARHVCDTFFTLLHLPHRKQSLEDEMPAN